MFYLICLPYQYIRYVSPQLPLHLRDDIIGNGYPSFLPTDCAERQRTLKLFGETIISNHQSSWPHGKMPDPGQQESMPYHQDVIKALIFSVGAFLSLHWWTFHDHLQGLCEGDLADFQYQWRIPIVFLFLKPSPVLEMDLPMYQKLSWFYSSGAYMVHFLLCDYFWDLIWRVQSTWVAVLIKTTLYE